MQLLEPPRSSAEKKQMRADRISRIGNKWLSRVTFDQHTIRNIAEQHIGLFAEGFMSLQTMLGRILPLASNPLASRTVVLYSSKEAGNSVYRQLVADDCCEATGGIPSQWQVGALTFSSIEGLRRLQTDAETIDMVILLDPTCMVYRARTLVTPRGATHDRPQIIVDFLTDNALNDIQPLLMIATTKLAAAVPTDLIARVFCRETFWYLDGPTIACR